MRTCAVCERSLLVGERAVRFAPDGEHFVDVCPLCQDVAVESCWLTSAYRRTIGGIAKSLGEPRASIVQLSGVNTEVVVTIAWDISWYQYRVSPESAQPVRLEERGHELRELEPSFREWNAHLHAEGRLVPDIARL